MIDLVSQLESLYDKSRQITRDASQLKILEVEKKNDYSFQQAWVRMKGFLEARNDVILTGDIDLYINRCVSEGC